MAPVCTLVLFIGSHLSITKVSYYTFLLFDIWDPFNVLLSQSQSYFSTWITVDTHCITKTYDDVIMMSSSSRAISLVYLSSTLFQILFSMLSTNNPIGSPRKPTARSFLPIWAPLRHLGKIFEKWPLEKWPPEIRPRECDLRNDACNSTPTKSLFMISTIRPLIFPVDETQISPRRNLISTNMT